MFYWKSTDGRWNIVLKNNICGSVATYFFILAEVREILFRGMRNVLFQCRQSSTANNVFLSKIRTGRIIAKQQHNACAIAQSKVHHNHEEYVSESFYNKSKKSYRLEHTQDYVTNVHVGKERAMAPFISLQKTVYWLVTSCNYYQNSGEFELTLDSCKNYSINIAMRSF